MAHFIEIGNILSQNIPTASVSPESYINESGQKFTFGEITEQEVSVSIVVNNVT